jgi:hypothetical protein
MTYLRKLREIADTRLDPDYDTYDQTVPINPETILKMVAVIEAAQEYSAHCPCVGLSYHGDHTTRCSALRNTLSALREHVEGKG